MLSTIKLSYQDINIRGLAYILIILSINQSSKISILTFFSSENVNVTYLSNFKKNAQDQSNRNEMNLVLWSFIF